MRYAGRARPRRRPLLGGRPDPALRAARRARRRQRRPQRRRGTPTFFVNGRRHQGAYDLETLKRAVLAAKAADRAPRRDGRGPGGARPFRHPAGSRPPAGPRSARLEPQVAAVALRPAPRDRQAQAGAGPRAPLPRVKRRSTVARSAPGSQARRRRSSPWRRRPGRRDPNGDVPGLAAVAGGVLDQVVDEHAQALGVAAHDRPALGGRRASRVVPGWRARTAASAESTSSATSTSSARGRRPASPRASAWSCSTRRGQARGVALGRFQRLARALASAAAAAGPSAERLAREAGQRSAQLMAGVGGEPPCRLERGLALRRRRAQPLEHGVEVARQVADLDGTLVGRNPDVEVGGLGDAAGRVAQPSQRRHRGRARARQRPARSPASAASATMIDDAPQAVGPGIQRLQPRGHLEHRAARQLTRHGPPLLASGGHGLRLAGLDEREVVRAPSRPTRPQDAAGPDGAHEAVGARVQRRRRATPPGRSPDRAAPGRPNGAPRPIPPGGGRSPAARARHGRRTRPSHLAIQRVAVRRPAATTTRDPGDQRAPAPTAADRRQGHPPGQAPRASHAPAA